MITTLLSTKGGAGRSTIALNLAVAAAAAGISTLLIDADRRAAIHQAFERRLLVADRYGLQRVDMRYSLSNMLPDALPAFITQFDEIFIDTPADSEHRIWKLVEASDRVLVPIAAGYQDFELTVRVADVLAVIKSKSPQLKVNCILNQWEAESPISGTILRNLERLTEQFQLPPLSSVIHHRPEYATAFSYGISVLEMEPGSEAAAEITALYAEIARTSLFH